MRQDSTEKELVDKKEVVKKGKVLTAPSVDDMIEDFVWKSLCDVTAVVPWLWLWSQQL